jgi:hypothetical protein
MNFEIATPSRAMTEGARAVVRPVRGKPQKPISSERGKQQTRSGLKLPSPVGDGLGGLVSLLSVKRSTRFLTPSQLVAVPSKPSLTSLAKGVSGVNRPLFSRGLR